MDTIFALASGRGKAGVAVIRVSGPQAFDAARSLGGDLPESHKVSLRTFRNDKGEVIDQGLVLPFKGPDSFTGEDVVELHTHGSPAVVRAILDFLGQRSGLRLADPGEFTRRALENGRLDLAQVEGLADLIDAETEAQRRQALRVFSGALGQRVEEWRALSIQAAALIEATIDFSDEEIPDGLYDQARALILDLKEKIECEIAGYKSAERIRDGFEVAIVGATNIGKSTLLNALAGREAALTSNIAGTTRDIIEVRMDLNGLPVTFLDTAGIRQTDDAIENAGIERAITRAKNADLRVFLVETGADKLPFEPDDEDIIAIGKADQLDTDEFGVSGLTGKGVSELMKRVGQILEGRVTGTETVIRLRHQQAMKNAVNSLEAASSMLAQPEFEIELVAEELRFATRELDSIIGRVGVEDLLGEIFSRFCIGK